MSAAIRQLAMVCLGLLLASLLGLSTCSPKLDALARVRHAGVLRVATTNTPTTCYDGARGKTGFECDLLAGLARQLGVRVELTFYDSTPAALEALLEHRADLAAAGINITPERGKQFRFGPPFQRAVLELVYRAGSQAPRDLSELSGHLVVVAHSSAEEQLLALKRHYPQLQWTTAAPGDDSEDLLSQVAEGRIDYTVANSDLVALNQRFYPQLRVAFDISDLQNIAWALPRDDDDSLYLAVQNYFQTLGDVGLVKLRDRYFAAAAQADYLGVSRFLADAQHKLPQVRPYFERAAQRYGLDWRLLAAIGYQESRWDAQAVSPTGVRGIMMLTVSTAAGLSVGDRSDPQQSIEGGARYFSGILEQLPPQIEEPDRMWMALAAYNQGLGHLLDARALAARRGGDPDSWIDVRDALALLSHERYYSQARYGYAQGRAAVAYVNNIRNYYDILKWMTQRPGTPAPTDDLEALADPPPFKSTGAARFARGASGFR
jgi:membrane-bound lytic murein transglycosylase F